MKILGWIWILLSVAAALQSPATHGFLEKVNPSFLLRESGRVAQSSGALLSRPLAHLHRLVGRMEPLKCDISASISRAEELNEIPGQLQTGDPSTAWRCELQSALEEQRKAIQALKFRSDAVLGGVCLAIALPFTLGAIVCAWDSLLKLKNRKRIQS